MLRRLELAGHSMITRMAQMETITNNLANINTKGFKKDKLFVHGLIEKIKALQKKDELSRPHVPYTAAVSDFTQGELVDTNRPFDVAITGEGFFVVEIPDGEAYTRDGRFALSADGILTTLDGKIVLGEGGPIEIDIEQNSASQILINEEGEILIDGKLSDKLQIITLDNPRKLIKMGSNLFQLADNSESPRPADNVSVKQGFLEESNVNPVSEMVAMIHILHAYRTSEKVIKTHDSILGKAVNNIGRV